MFLVWGGKKPCNIYIFFEGVRLGLKEPYIVESRVDVGPKSVVPVPVKSPS